MRASPRFFMISVLDVYVAPWWHHAPNTHTDTNIAPCLLLYNIAEPSTETSIHHQSPQSSTMPDTELSYVILFEDGVASELNVGALEFDRNVDRSWSFTKVRDKIYEKEHVWDRRKISPSEISIYTPGQLTLKDITNDAMSLHVKTAIEGLKPVYALDKVSNIPKQLIPDDTLVRLVLVARRPQLVGHPPSEPPFR
ncbi:uncharacterized protein LAESUDRAFT_160103 [Laetiporus sulphureus 93-53]|uniref:Uncharacterized protein n=1 Tax=Laetiporus sulphureus 93-53 TaxID=1314785 RepID=A0A165HN61_9APHY|nr:uncharacterized protein LAESUDRAFT_160103 [Laetiporus sulphureus 93-53]KZT11956.1 hypothetical protein LAESUDRAFT_160103 [Laetiporus sulphureus 93-53]